MLGFFTDGLLKGSSQRLTQSSNDHMELPSYSGVNVSITTSVPALRYSRDNVVSETQVSV